MRAEPTPQQGPEPFHGIHMDFTRAVTIFISGELAPAMVDTPMVVSPAIQASINAILVCIHTCTWNDGVGPIGKKGVTYAAFLRGVTNLWGISPWIAADG